MKARGLKDKVEEHQKNNKYGIPRDYRNEHGFTGTKDDIDNNNTYNEAEREEEEETR